MLTGPSLAEVDREISKILGKFKGKIILPEFENGWQIWDVLGAELRYNRSKRCFKLSMQTYFEKLADKFNVRAGSSSPNVEESPVWKESPAINFPFREMIGSLQWVSTIARPDVARNVNFLSRFFW